MQYIYYYENSHVASCSTLYALPVLVQILPRLGLLLSSLILAKYVLQIYSKGATLDVFILASLNFREFHKNIFSVCFNLVNSFKICGNSCKKLAKILF